MTQYPTQPGHFPQQPGGFPQQPGGFPQQQTPPPVPASNRAMPSLADQIAKSGGVKSFFNKHSKIGDAVQGPVTNSEMIHSVDFDTQQLEYWDDNEPKYKVRITVQTDLRDPQDPNDDGQRAIYINTWGDNWKNLLATVQAAQDSDVRIGGYFGAQYTEDRPNQQRPHLNPAKIYQYWYQVPQPGAGMAGLPGMEDTPAPAAAAPVPAAPQQQQQPPAAAPQQDPWTGAPQQQQQPPVEQQQQPAAAAAPAAGPDQQIIKFIGLGLSDEEIAGATGVTPAQVAAVRATQ